MEDDSQLYPLRIIQWKRFAFILPQVDTVDRADHAQP